MNRSDFNKSVVPGLFDFMSASYKPRSEEKVSYQLLTGGSPRKSLRAYEENAYWGALGLLPAKGEGEPIQYDNPVQGPTKRWNHKTYGLGVRITEELIEDCLYPDIPTEMKQLTSELGKSARETIEILTWDLVNNGTNTTTHTDGLGGAIFSTGKALLRGGTWSNLLNPNADLSSTSLQTALDTFENTRDDAGKIQVIKASKIFVNPANAWKAAELLHSAYDPESGNNSTNELKARNLQLISSAFMTDTDAFLLWAEPANEGQGFIAYMRRPVSFAQDGDFNTGDALFKSTFRYSAEVNKANNVFLSQGA